MELMLFLWLAGVVEVVGGFFFAIGLVTAGILLFCAIYNTLEGEPFKPKIWIVVLMCSSSLIAVFIPKQDTLYLMGAGYLGQRAVQSETADKVLKIVNGKLDEYLNDVEKSIKEGVKK